jgi:two-component system response regulator HydG
MSVSVAIVGAEPQHWEKLSGIISSCGLCPVRCETLAAATKLSAQQHFEFAICDDELPDGNFRELIAELRRSRHSTPVVVISRFDDWASYLEAMIAGAFEYVAFPLYPQELERAVAAALAEAQANRNAVPKAA